MGALLLMTWVPCAMGDMWHVVSTCVMLYPHASQGQQTHTPSLWIYSNLSPGTNLLKITPNRRSLSVVWRWHEDKGCRIATMYTHDIFYIYEMTLCKMTFCEMTFCELTFCELMFLMSYMTLSYLWHDQFICVTWLIHMCDMTHSYVWHDSFSGAGCHVWHDSLAMCGMTDLLQSHDLLQSYDLL